MHGSRLSNPRSPCWCDRHSGPGKAAGGAQCGLRSAEPGLQEWRKVRNGAVALGGCVRLNCVRLTGCVVGLFLLLLGLAVLIDSWQQSQLPPPDDQAKPQANCQHETHLLLEAGVALAHEPVEHHKRLECHHPVGVVEALAQLVDHKIDLLARGVRAAGDFKGCVKGAREASAGGGRHGGHKVVVHRAPSIQQNQGGGGSRAPDSAMDW